MIVFNKLPLLVANTFGNHTVATETQGELGIGIDNRSNGGIQIFLGNVSLVDES